MLDHSRTTNTHLSNKVYHLHMRNVLPQRKGIYYYYQIITQFYFLTFSEKMGIVNQEVTVIFS